MTATTESSRTGALDVDVDDPQAPARRGRSRSGSFGLWLGGAAGLGLLIRLMNVFWWRPTTDRPGYLGYRLWGDAFYYHHQANELADGKFFINPIKYVFDGVEVASAGHPPLYTIYLSFWSFFGIDSVTAHRVVSGFLGVATIIVVGFVGRRLAGNAAGVIAATIVAVYPFFWINDGMVMSESLVVLVAAVVLATAYSFVRSPNTRNAVWFGLACGAGALTRTEMALLFPLLLVPLALLARTLARRDRFKLAVVGCVVGAALVAPWVAFNLARFDKPVFLSTGIGNTLAYGSCDETFYGNLIGYYAVCFTGPYPKGDESVRDAAPRKYALDYIENHKSRVPLVVAARVGRLWGLFKPGQTTAFDWWIEGRGRVPSWISLFFYYAMIPFAAVGLVRMWRRKITILPIIVPMVIATFAAATTFGITRYRAPAEVGIVLAAAIGIATAWAWLRDKRISSEART
jgi:4-amino-4-deoxy-L-arabinose transferase-like glycosyltransferase